jgi:DNA-binding response OmpR family regulator
MEMHLGERWQPRPKLLLAHTDARLRFLASCHFDDLGVDLVGAGTASTARSLARLLTPEVIVLGAELPDESGYLACAKLKAERPEHKVYLVGRFASGEARRFARYVGAEDYLATSEGWEEIAVHIAEHGFASNCG